MTTNTTTAPADGGIRTYGGWRRARGWGLWGLSQGETVAVLAALLLPILALPFAWQITVALLPVSAVVVGAATIRVDGIPVGHAIARRWRFFQASRRGYTRYDAGVLTDHPDTWRLPGALATTKLLSVEDVTGREFGMVWNQRTGELTATLRCAAVSMGLVDPQVSDGWVAAWHAWLARLGHEPTVRHVAVTIDSAPEPGSRLAANVAAATVDDAPADAVALLEELVAKSPAAAADVETRVSITFQPDAGPRKLADQAERTAEVSRLLRGMESALGGCGVAVKGRATAAELAGLLRVAYDPHSRGEVTSALAHGWTSLIGWDTAGPIGADEAWNRYVHDSGMSASLVWQEPPRQVVPSQVLEPLLTPQPFATRVTLLYRPLPAAAAAAHVDDEVNAATFRDALRRRQGRDQTARDQADHDRAVQAAREEAAGAGMVRCDLYVTVTIDDHDDHALAEAVATVRSAAEASKIRLRPLNGSQQLGFQTTLPAGLDPAALAGRSRR
ncbi:SCO6880 family protein [Salsipaludibacter albus]|uniref:SCO6880 family protein n=1 Tax=Salsipaludibacter albus TaxID=2849650 RepID=UPI001EE3EC84|nr:SCO6880 family protein [Salsipaludibacter albus]MBY5163296.1 hypothetical protein [Salsipaludibacter albus]